MSTDPTKTCQKRGGRPAGRARSAARLAAVQALYQIQISGGASREVVREFVTHRLGTEIEGDVYIAADTDFFSDLVIGTERRLQEIDKLIAHALSSNWSLDRLERLMRAVLRAGTYELVARPDVPTKVIIDEYVDVAHAFFSEKEPGFVNGVLDRLGKSVRHGGSTPGGKEATT
ncbi:MAG TPA: transcription antitermination factor NusB [Sneathiellales bacterium]|nr:transcription antitermination factor NusB [Sneathiellales bacterium]